MTKKVYRKLFRLSEAGHDNEPSPRPQYTYVREPAGASGQKPSPYETPEISHPLLSLLGPEKVRQLWEGFQRLTASALSSDKTLVAFQALLDKIYEDAMLVAFLQQPGPSVDIFFKHLPRLSGSSFSHWSLEPSSLYGRLLQDYRDMTAKQSEEIPPSVYSTERPPAQSPLSLKELLESTAQHLAHTPFRDVLPHSERVIEQPQSHDEYLNNIKILKNYVEKLVHIGHSETTESKISEVLTLYPAAKLMHPIAPFFLPPNVQVDEAFYAMFPELMGHRELPAHMQQVVEQNIGERYQTILKSFTTHSFPLLAEVATTLEGEYRRYWPIILRNPDTFLAGLSCYLVPWTPGNLRKDIIQRASQKLTKNAGQPIDLFQDDLETLRTIAADMPPSGTFLSERDCERLGINGTPQGIRRLSTLAWCPFLVTCSSHAALDHVSDFLEKIVIRETFAISHTPWVSRRFDRNVSPIGQELYDRLQTLPVLDPLLDATGAWKQYLEELISPGLSELVEEAAQAYMLDEVRKQWGDSQFFQECFQEECGSGAAAMLPVVLRLSLFNAFWRQPREPFNSPEARQTFWQQELPRLCSVEGGPEVQPASMLAKTALLGPVFSLLKQEPAKYILPDGHINYEALLETFDQQLKPGYLPMPSFLRSEQMAALPDTDRVLLGSLMETLPFQTWSPLIAQRLLDLYKACLNSGILLSQTFPTWQAFHLACCIPADSPNFLEDLFRLGIPLLGMNRPPTLASALRFLSKIEPSELAIAALSERGKARGVQFDREYSQRIRNILDDAPRLLPELLQQPEKIQQLPWQNIKENKQLLESFLIDMGASWVREAYYKYPEILNKDPNNTGYFLASYICPELACKGISEGRPTIILPNGEQISSPHGRHAIIVSSLLTYFPELKEYPAAQLDFVATGIEDIHQRSSTPFYAFFHEKAWSFETFKKLKGLLCSAANSGSWRSFSEYADNLAELSHKSPEEILDYLRGVAELPTHCHPKVLQYLHSGKPLPTSTFFYLKHCSPGFMQTPDPYFSIILDNLPALGFSPSEENIIGSLSAAEIFWVQNLPRLWPTPPQSSGSQRLFTATVLALGNQLAQPWYTIPTKVQAFIDGICKKKLLVNKLSEFREMAQLTPDGEGLERLYLATCVYQPRVLYPNHIPLLHKMVKEGLGYTTAATPEELCRNVANVLAAFPKGETYRNYINSVIQARHGSDAFARTPRTFYTVLSATGAALEGIREIRDRKHIARLLAQNPNASPHLISFLVHHWSSVPEEYKTQDLPSIISYITQALAGYTIETPLPKEEAFALLTYVSPENWDDIPGIVSFLVSAQKVPQPKWAASMSPLQTELGYRAGFEPRGSVRALFLGAHMGNCQEIYSAAPYAAIHSCAESTGSLFLVETPQKEAFAASWVWENRLGDNRTFIAIDSIESSGASQDKSKFAADAYIKLMEHLLQFADMVVLGPVASDISPALSEALQQHPHIQEVKQEIEIPYPSGFSNQVAANLWTQVLQQSLSTAYYLADIQRNRRFYTRKTQRNT